MALINPVDVFKEDPQAFDAFLRALSTLHQTGVLEMLREMGRVRCISENSPNYVAAQAAGANWSRGFNEALDNLIYFRQLYLDQDTTNTQPPLSFGSLERALESGDLTQEEIDAIRNDKPIPTLKREFTPGTVFISKPGSGPGSSG